MIGGCDQEREFKMNAEQPSPGSESDGCSEDLQKYFGQSGYHRLLSPADRLGVGVSNGIVDVMGDEPMKPSDQMEFDAELSSIFFGMEEEQPHQKNQSSVEESHPGGLLRNQKGLHDSSILDARPLTRLSTEWTSNPAEWNWPNDCLHRTAENDSSEEEREAAAAWRGKGKDGPMTHGTIDGDGHHHELELEESSHPTADIRRYQIPPSDLYQNTGRSRNPHTTHHDLFMSEPPSLQYIDSSLSLNPVPSHKSMHYPPPHHLDLSYYHLHHQMTLPTQKWAQAFPLDLPQQLCASLSNPTSQPNPIDQLLAGSVAEDDQHLIDLEFNHLVAEEQCAPSTPSSSFSAQGRSTHPHHLQKHSLKPGFTQPFLTIDPLSGLFDQSTPSLCPPPPALKDLHDLNDPFSNLISSTFELFPASSAPLQPVSLPPPFSNPFLISDPPASTAATIDSSLASQLQPSPLLDHPPGTRHPFEPSLPSTSSLPSPSTLSHPPAATPRSTPRNRLPAIRPSESRDPLEDNPLLNRPQSRGALNKSNAATAEVPTEVELAIPRLDRLNLSEACPEDLQLLLIGLQAQGAKTRVETQIKLTLVLVTGQGGSIDRNGNLSTENQHTLTRIGNWSHIKLPVYSAIKRKSKKLIKTGIPPEETLFLEVAVVRASEPHDEIYCCSNCQVREQKRTQRKRDARVRPAQEIESDEAEQSIRPEDEKRKIVVFNCGQYVGFESGEVTLPTRITCYCRHHREKKGFRVKITLLDHTHRLVASSITPAIMITDDHKAVAAAAKAKSGSDAEDNQPRGRLIRRLPNTGSQPIAPGPCRGRKKLLSAWNESTSETQIASGSTDDKERYDSAPGWTNSLQNGTEHVHSPSPSSSRSTSTKCKRKAPNELNLRANIGRKTNSNQTAASTPIVELSDKQTLQCAFPPQESRPHSATSARSLSIPMPSSASHLRSATPGSAYAWHGCPSFPKQPWQEEMSILPRTEIDASLARSMDMKDLINPLHKIDQECMDTDQKYSPPPPPLNDPDAEKSLNCSSIITPSHIASVTEPCDLARLGSQGGPTNQQCHNTSRPSLNCSTTSSPDQAGIFPCSAHFSTSSTSGCSDTSPKSSVDSRQYTQFKCSNPTSPSSSIVCTQSRADSDSSAHTCESSRSMRLLPSQSDSPLDPLAGDPGDQSEPYCNNRNDISRTCSPTDDTTMATLGNALANWNDVSSLLPSSSQALDVRTSPVEKILPRSQEATKIHPMFNQEPSSGPQGDSDQPQAKLTKLVPNEGPTEGGIEITILGSHFYPGIKVDFGSCGVVQTQFWSTNTLICVLPPSAHPGPCEVSLVEADTERRQNKTLGLIFTYVKRADRRLMELALQVVGLKMTGQLQDAISFARKIIVETKQFESASGSSLNYAVNSMNVNDYQYQKITSMGLNALKTLEGHGKQINVQEDALLGMGLYSYIEEKCRELPSTQLVDMIWILCILVIAGVCGLSIMTRIINKHKLLRQWILLK